MYLQENDVIDLTRFSGKGDIRQYINSPWQEDGKSFATNGYMAVMVDGVADPEMPGVFEKMAGKIQEIVGKTDGYSQALDIKLPDDPAPQCPLCKGSGHLITAECEECDGDGWFEHGSHSYNCKECDGAGVEYQPVSSEEKGAEQCEKCFGSGSESRFLTFVADDGKLYRLQEKYLRLAMSLPGLRFLVGGDSQAAVRFEFDGGAGVLMPCRY